LRLRGAPLPILYLFPPTALIWKGYAPPLKEENLSSEKGWKQNREFKRDEVPLQKKSSPSP